MSRIGKTPIQIPTGVTVTPSGMSVEVTGPKGKLVCELFGGTKVTIEGQQIVVTSRAVFGPGRALHGLVRARLANMIKGVTEGWTKKLELSGVGYRAAIEGTNLVLTIGFSHTVTVKPPPGIVFSVVEGKIIVTGIDKETVGQSAANIRNIRKPEPYKGKGIKYLGEYIRKKAGKSAKTVGGTAAK